MIGDTGWRWVKIRKSGIERVVALKYPTLRRLGWESLIWWQVHQFLIARANLNVEAMLHASKRLLSREWLAWSEWTACSATCGNSLRSRWRTRRGFVMTYTDSVQYFVEPCAIPSCKFGELLTLDHYSFITLLKKSRSWIRSLTWNSHAPNNLTHIISSRCF